MTQRRLLEEMYSEYIGDAEPRTMTNEELIIELLAFVILKVDGHID